MALLSVSKIGVIASQCAHYSALRAAAQRRLRSVRACGRSGVAISRISELFHPKIESFYFFLGDRHTSGAPRSESEIPMIASGNHTIMSCGLVRNDSKITSSSADYPYTYNNHT